MIAALAATIIATCPWPERGLDRFMGDVPGAVETYTDIPKPVRDRLKARMQKLQYDDIAHLTVNGQSSERWIYSNPTMMHFGDGSKICRTVDVSMWRQDDPGERGLVYCESGHCVIVYTVCRNVSRINRIQERKPPPIPAEPPAAEIPPVPFALDVPIPTVEPGPLSDEYTPQPFARLSQPEPVKEPEPERITADQTFYELWSRPLLYGQVSWSLFAWPTATPLVVSFQPVPSVFPSIPSSPVFDSPIIVRTPDGLPGSIAPIPEPGTIVLFFAGLAIVGWMARRKTV